MKNAQNGVSIEAFVESFAKGRPEPALEFARLANLSFQGYTLSGSPEREIRIAWWENSELTALYYLAEISECCLHLCALRMEGNLRGASPYFEEVPCRAALVCLNGVMYRNSASAAKMHPVALAAVYMEGIKAARHVMYRGNLNMSIHDMWRPYEPVTDIPRASARPLWGKNSAARFAAEQLLLTDKEQQDRLSKVLASK